MVCILLAFFQRWFCLVEFEGSIVVDGHELHEEDLRLMYTFDQTSGSAAQYEAHSDAQVGFWLKHGIHFQSWSVSFLYSCTPEVSSSIVTHNVTHLKGDAASLLLHPSAVSVNGFFAACDVWNHFMAKWRHAVRLFPQGLSNQYSSSRIHSTQMHLNTSVLNWLFNSPLYSLIHTNYVALICLSFSLLYFSFLPMIRTWHDSLNHIISNICFLCFNLVSILRLLE